MSMIDIQSQKLDKIVSKFYIKGLISIIQLKRIVFNKVPRNF